MSNLTPKQQYEARKADRQRRREARETLNSETQSIVMEEMLDRFVTAVERIADALEARSPATPEMEKAPDTAGKVVAA